MWTLLPPSPVAPVNSRSLAQPRSPPGFPRTRVAVRSSRCKVSASPTRLSSQAASLPAHLEAISLRSQPSQNSPAPATWRAVIWGHSHLTTPQLMKC